MAYACPVCAEPQIDAEHLANHLAFTAIGGDDAHEEWLDSTVGEWGQLGQADLADIVVEHAEETEFPVADVESHADHEHNHDHQGETRSVSADASSLDEDATAVLADAREMTREMMTADGKDEESESPETSSDNETQ